MGVVSVGWVLKTNRQGKFHQSDEQTQKREETQGQAPVFAKDLSRPEHTLSATLLSHPLLQQSAAVQAQPSATDLISAALYVF